MVMKNCLYGVIVVEICGLPDFDIDWDSTPCPTYTALLIPTVSTSTFHSTNLFLFSCHHTPTNSVAPPSAYKLTHNPQFLQLLWQRADARNISIFTLFCGQFTLSTQLLTLNYLLHSTNYFQWLNLESWVIKWVHTPLKRCQQLPVPYKQLIH